MGSRRGRLSLRLGRVAGEQRVKGQTAGKILDKARMREMSGTGLQASEELW